MKKTVFRGIATALVTPIDERGVDYEKLGRLIDWQIEQGSTGWSFAAPRVRRLP